MGQCGELGGTASSQSPPETRVLPSSGSGRGGHLSQEGFLDLFQGRRWKMLRATFLLLLFSQNPSYQNIEDIEVWYYGVACSEPHHILNFLLLGTLTSDGIGMATGSR